LLEFADARPDRALGMRVNGLGEFRGHTLDDWRLYKVLGTCAP
jgi:hypothetical protein